MTIDSGAPITAVTGATAIIDIEHDKAALHQQMMKHVFAIVGTPPAMHGLQVTCAMHEDYRGPATLVILRNINAAIDSRAITRFEAGDRRIDPVVSKKFGNRRSRHGFE